MKNLRLLKKHEQGLTECSGVGARFALLCPMDELDLSIMWSLTTVSVTLFPYYYFPSVFTSSGTSQTLKMG